jgi:uncharacterized protein (DUF1501 family)
MTDHAPHEPHGRNLLGRRALLQLAGAAGIATTTSLAGARFAFGAPGDGDVLVVLSLRGGFDGLAAVAPVGDPEWTKLRPNIGTPERAVKRVDDVFGLHPAMSPLFGAWTEGELAVVHAVGQPSDSRSHAVATAELERAAAASVRTGWVDRVQDVAKGGLLGATQLGNPALPAAMTGPRAELSVGRLANQQLAVKEEVVPLAAWQRAFDELNVNARPQIARPTEWALDGVAALRPLATQTTGSAGSVPYPEGQLGETLADLARLVRARSGVNVATVDVDGWDLHADAGRFDGGRMRDRLRELSQGMAAFRDDLGADFGRVTVVTLSEFGRRAAENGSGGTDHGHGNAVLVFGGAVRGGRVYGRWPGLAADRLADGDLAATTDYRSILAEVLGSRLGVSASSVFPGFKPASLGVVKPR